MAGSWLIPRFHIPIDSKNTSKEFPWERKAYQRMKGESRGKVSKGKGKVESLDKL
jgi:hypothetical protein